MLRDLNSNTTGGASSGGGSGARNNNNVSSNKSGNPHARAVRILMQELKSLQDEPMEGFKCKLMQDSDLFHWEVALFGPPDTPYSGGYFKALMSFPTDYPFSPPTVKFLNKIWHPNIYHSGEVCISILHPPNDDPQSGELPQERWNPAQSVRTVLMSVISLLNEPNTASPANVDASVMYRRYKESVGKDKEYEKIIRQNVDESLKEAAKDGVEVPKNADEYTAVSRTVRHTEKRKLGEEDFYAEVDWYADDEAHGGPHGARTAGGVGGTQSRDSGNFLLSNSPSSALVYDADDESSQVNSTPVSAAVSRKSLTTMLKNSRRGHEGGTGLLSSSPDDKIMNNHSSSVLPDRTVVGASVTASRNTDNNPQQDKPSAPGVRSGVNNAALKPGEVNSAAAGQFASQEQLPPSSTANSSNQQQMPSTNEQSRKT